MAGASLKDRLKVGSKESIVIRMDKEVLKQVDAWAKSIGTSRNKLVSEIIKCSVETPAIKRIIEA